MELKILQLERCGKKPPLPKYQTEDAAAMDIAAFLPEEGEVVIQPGAWKLIPTGLHHLSRSKVWRENETVIVGVGHDKCTHETGRNTPRSSPNIFVFVLVGEELHIE